MVNNSTNDFDYLLVLDFEAQCIQNAKLDCQEIIEFPVVVVDVSAQKVIDKYFHSFVKPTVYPKLTDFCTELTGITQDKVDSADTLEIVLEKLDKFLEECGILKSKFCFVTCGDWDLRTCLRSEAKYKKLKYQDYLNSWINVKKVFGSLSGYTKVGMPKMLSDLNLTLDGRHHSGIDDAKNIAKIVVKLLQEEANFTKDYLTTNKK
jgi:inhibitor of KinA sporulation pathway (predicted exonuclease)